MKSYASVKANAIFCLGFLGVALSAHAGRQDPELKRYEFAEPHLGTQIRLVIFADRDPTALVNLLFKTVAELNNVFSDYDDGSELMQLCRAAPNQPHHVSALLFDVLDRAQGLAKETDGAFDITVGPLSELWRRARRQGRLPDPAAIHSALQRTGYRKVSLDRKERTVTLAQAGMRLDLGGIAKGYIGDRVMSVLARRYPHSMIALGGDLVLGQAPPGELGWKVQVGPKEVLGVKPITLLLSDCAVSTSGDLEQYLEVGGKRYSHLIDPRTGWGQEAAPMVSVVANSGWEADALTKPLSLMPLKDAQKLLENHVGAAARWIIRKDANQADVVVSRRWQRLRQVATE